MLCHSSQCSPALSGMLFLLINCPIASHICYSNQYLRLYLPVALPELHTAAITVETVEHSIIQMYARCFSYMSQCDIPVIVALLARPNLTQFISKFNQRHAVSHPKHATTWSFMSLVILQPSRRILKFVMLDLEHVTTCSYCNRGSTPLTSF